MIMFNHFSISLFSTVLVLTLICLSSIISSILNPIVFFYNKKKSSIAGLLFCVLSVSDFSTCLVWPCIVSFYAATVDLKDMNCYENNSGSRQPQNCFRNASTTNLVTAVLQAPLKSSCFVTAGVLAVVRSIQIRYPFYPIKKSRVIIIMPFFILLQAASWITISSITSSANGGAIFYAASYISFSQNPFNLRGYDVQSAMNLTAFISCLPVTIIESFAVVSSVLTAVTLIQLRNPGGVTNLAKKRIAGAVKVLLTNLPSLIYVLIIGTSALLVIKLGSSGDIATENDGWERFFVVNMFPVLS